MTQRRVRVFPTWMPIWWAISAISFASLAFAAVTNSATLSSGQTTQDGKLTLVVFASTTGALSVSLKNNDIRTVMVDAYSLSRGPLFACSGRGLRIPSNVIHHVCTLPKITDADRAHALPQAPSNKVSAASGELPSIAARNMQDQDAGHASLQMSLTWHQMARSSPTGSFSPS